MNEVITDECTEAERREKHHMRHAEANKPDKPWDAEIDVTLTSAGPPAAFTIDTPLPKDPNGNIIFNNNGRPGFKIKFRLYDNTNNGNGSGYAFPQGGNKSDAVWSQLGATGCPSSGIWDVFDQSSITIQDGGATLVVHNPNPSPAQGQFRYTLNVTTTGGPPYLPLDPGGTNMNGSSTRFNS